VITATLPDAATAARSLPAAAIDVDFITDLYGATRGRHLVHAATGPDSTGRITALCWADAGARMRYPRARVILRGQSLPSGACSICLAVAAGATPPLPPMCTRPACADVEPHAGLS
jgi:hypothetical protein